MAVKASATITLTSYRDTQSVTRYYKLQTAGSSTPDPPSTKVPSSDWTKAEPACDISKTLYFCDLTVFSNGDWEYSTVSKSSSYEAAKEAYNKANNAQSSIDNLEIGGRNLYPNSKGPFTLTPKNTGNAEDNYNYYSFYADMAINEIYTISADIEITDGEFTKVSILSYREGTYIECTIPENGRIQGTFTKTSESTKSVLIYAGISGATRGNGIIIRNVKIEKGNKATDWTPAPEDVDAGIADAKDEAQIAQDMTTTLDGEFSDFKESDYSQITDSVGDLMEYKNNNIDKIAQIEEELSKELVSKKFASIENGSLILGETNGTTAILQNDQFGFYSPNSEVPAAYFGKNDDAWAFNIERGIIKNDLRFGQFQWIARANGNMSLKWIG